MYLIVPKQWLGESPLTCKHITGFSSTIKPLLLLEAKVICNTQETSIINAMQEISDSTKTLISGDLVVKGPKVVTKDLDRAGTKCQCIDNYGYL